MADLRRWLFAGAGMAALAVLLFTALLAGTPSSPVLAPTTPLARTTPSAVAVPSASPTAPPSPTAAPGEPIIVWLARDSLPPIAIRAATSPMRETTREARIAARLIVLAALQPHEIPAGAANVLATSRTKPTVRDVRIDGEIAHVDWNVPNGDWGVGGTARKTGLLEQIVYTRQRRSRASAASCSRKTAAGRRHL